MSERPKFENPTVVYITTHISGLKEVGIGLEYSVEFFLVKSTAFSKGDTLTKDEYWKFKQRANQPYRSDSCYCCEAPAENVDRGVPLCNLHQAQQDHRNWNRPQYFSSEVKYKEDDPLSIIF